MKCFTDIHSHVIYGVDDGPRTDTEMYNMLDAAARDGIVRLYATSHFIPGVRAFAWDVYEKNLKKAQAYCRERGYDLQICRGAELLYTPMMSQYMVNYELPVMGKSNSVLVEFSEKAKYSDIECALDLINGHGYTAILAHIERYPCLFGFNKAEKLKDNHDVRFQVNAGSVLGMGGLVSRMALSSWLNKGIIDHVASDAHDCVHRVFRMSSAYEALSQTVGKKYAAYLTRMRGMPDKLV